MDWTYKLSSKAYQSIISKRQMADRRRDEALVEKDAHSALVDLLALEYLLKKLGELSIAQVDPAMDPNVRTIPHGVGQLVHVFFREKPYTAFYKLDTTNRRASMIDFCHDDDPGSIFHLSDEPPQDRPSSWSRISPQSRYQIILSGSFLISVSGLFLACVFRQAGYASRAGAISTIMGNALILVRPDYGRGTYESRMGATADISDAERIKTQANALGQWLSINSDGQTYQNKALVIAAIIGTLFWGFGDMLAIYIMHLLGIIPLCSC